MELTGGGRAGGARGMPGVVVSRPWGRGDEFLTRGGSGCAFGLYPPLEGKARGGMKVEVPNFLWARREESVYRNRMVEKRLMERAPRPSLAPTRSRRVSGLSFLW